MIGFAWVTLRQAQEALKNGHLEEAQRLLGQPSARGHKGFWELAPQVAQAYVERGEHHLLQDDSEAAWHDLVQAEQVGGAGAGLDRLRQSLVRRGLGEARALLHAGEPGWALEAIHRLNERSVRHPDMQLLEESARCWQQARDHAQRGDFRLALDTIERVKRLLPDAVEPLSRLRCDIEQRQQPFAGLLAKLHEAVDQHHWREVLDLCEQALAAAPNHVEARRARALAWKAVEPATAVLRSPGRLVEPSKPEAEPPPRFLLWIDGVGGYLVCLSSRISLGQATSDSTVDVPLFADVSRLHATLTRDSEGYLFEAARSAAVNGKAAERALLRPNDRITLGMSCQLQFLQPAAISTSARLNLVSKHRMPLAVDAVLLMADTLLLGAGSQVHVPIPDLAQPIVLYRNKDRLGVRYSGNLAIDGQQCAERGLLTLNSTVTADEIAFTLEPIAKNG